MRFWAAASGAIPGAGGPTGKRVSGVRAATGVWVVYGLGAAVPCLGTALTARTPRPLVPHRLVATRPLS